MIKAQSNKVLLVDDRTGDIQPTMDFIESRGFEVTHVRNEQAAMTEILKVKNGDVFYALGIFDIMLSVMDIMEMIDIDELVLQESMNSGIRLCEYARQELALTEQDLFIVCISGRDDPEVREALDRLGIRLFDRHPADETDSLRAYLDANLPDLSKARE